MEEFIVINNATFIQYKVVKQGDEYKVYSMNGSEAKVSYNEIVQGLENGKYKKM